MTREEYAATLTDRARAKFIEGMDLLEALGFSEPEYDWPDALTGELNVTVCYKAEYWMVQQGSFACARYGVNIREALLLFVSFVEGALRESEMTCPTSYARVDELMRLREYIDSLLMRVPLC